MKSVEVYEHLVRLESSQGEIFKTQCPTNLGINGLGFFIVQRGGKNYYTRDGRFEFSGGELRNTVEEASVLGIELDSQGNPAHEDEKPKPICLSLDPRTRLYSPKYSGYHFDETGKLYGEATTTDPVTGQTITASCPLMQIALAAFDGNNLAHSPLSPTLLLPEGSDPPVVGVGLQGVYGAICPGSLELANVDFIEEGYVISSLKSYAGLLLGNDGSRPLPPAPTIFSAAPPPRNDLMQTTSNGRPFGFYDNATQHH